MGWNRCSFEAFKTLLWIALLVSGFVMIGADITLGSKLLPAQTTGWLSSQKTFNLAFYSAGAGGAYYVGIMYHTIAAPTVVWTAGRNVQVDRNASFELDAEGDLVLLNLTSGTQLWNSNTSNLGVTGATMREDGNFVLYNSSSVPVWQSFDSPTDTLLPSQRLTIDKFLQAVSLASPYTSVMESSGNLSLKWNNSVTYWGSGTAGSGVKSALPSYASLDSAAFGLYNTTGSVQSWKSNDYTDSSVSLRRVTLDGDGNLRIYGWSPTSSAWKIGWQAVEDQCRVYGFCGDNGLCAYNSTDPTCICPETAGYGPIEASNPRKGCRTLANPLNCSAAPVTMVKVDHSVLFDPPDDSNSTSYRAGQTDCGQICLKDSFCMAATALDDGSGTCQMKRGASFSGYEELSTSASSFFKVCGTAPPVASSSSPTSSSSSSSSSVVVSVVASTLGTLFGVILIQVALWCCFCRKNPRFWGYSAQYALLEYASGAPVQFSYKELQIATQNFQEKLGEGGFGKVYKGVLTNKMEVAVKQLEGVDQGEKQFRMEVATIGSTHHMNLVRLCGFCAEAKHRLLVYEFLKMGSLDRYLFDTSENSPPQLEWETRFNVLLGTARGITYLHQECRDCIIHCDIKPENILLDVNFCAKVSDFGLARTTNLKDRARTLTSVRGTRGYLAPEWRSNLPITAKSDVFSFGIVVLETISGRRNFDTSMGGGSSSERRRFSEWAFHEYFEHKRDVGVVDERLRRTMDMEQLDRAMRVCFWCMQEQPSLRPSMSKVIQMLEGTTSVERPPMPRLFGDLYAQEAAILRSLQEEEEEEEDGSSLNTNKTHTSLIVSPSQPMSTSGEETMITRSF